MKSNFIVNGFVLFSVRTRKSLPTTELWDYSFTMLTEVHKEIWIKSWVRCEVRAEADFSPCRYTTVPALFVKKVIPFLLIICFLSIIPFLLVSSCWEKKPTHKREASIWFPLYEILKQAEPIDNKRKEKMVGLGLRMENIGQNEEEQNSLGTRNVLYLDLDCGYLR